MPILPIFPRAYARVTSRVTGSLVGRLMSVFSRSEETLLFCSSVGKWGLSAGMSLKVYLISTDASPGSAQHLFRYDVSRRKKMKWNCQRDGSNSGLTTQESCFSTALKAETTLLRARLKTLAPSDIR